MMGVQHLWQILAPVKSEVPIETLKGKKIAVDLAIWLVESQVTGIKMMQGRVAKPHLRNLFFRVSHFLRLGVKLVFVIDGKPPELKWETMARRNEGRIGGGGGGRGGWRGRGREGQRGGGRKKASRSHFACWLRECQELLELMGLPCVQSKGEAEAMCAALNSSGNVDGCLTEDGDAFLYGARTVYRNLNMATGKVDCYSMDDVETDLGLDRRRLVALSLMLGCDYLPKGVPGIGKEVATQFINSLPSKMDPLKIFYDWRRGCDVTNVEGRGVRKKCLRVEGFPSDAVITEFLENKEKPPSRQSKWRRPLLSHLQEFNLLKMEWPKEYTEEKVVPLMTLFDLTHPTSNLRLRPASIVKLRVRQGVPCVEVKWHKPDDDKENEEDENSFYTTIEEKELFSSAFPEMMEQFMVAMEIKKNKGRGKKKKDILSTQEHEGAPDDVAMVSASKCVGDSDYMLVQSHEQACMLDLERHGGQTGRSGGPLHLTGNNRSLHDDINDDNDEVLMRLSSLSLSNAKSKLNLKLGRQQRNGVDLLKEEGTKGKRKKKKAEKTTQDYGARSMTEKSVDLGKHFTSEILSREVNSAATSSKSQSKQSKNGNKQAVMEKEEEKEEEEESEADEDESFMEVLPLSQRLGCLSLQGVVMKPFRTRNLASSTASNEPACPSLVSLNRQSKLGVITERLVKENTQAKVINGESQRDICAGGRSIKVDAFGDNCKSIERTAPSLACEELCFSSVNDLCDNANIPDRKDDLPHETTQTMTGLEGIASVTYVTDEYAHTTLSDRASHSSHLQVKDAESTREKDSGIPAEDNLKFSKGINYSDVRTPCQRLTATHEFVIDLTQDNPYNDTLNICSLNDLKKTEEFSPSMEVQGSSLDSIIPAIGNGRLLQELNDHGNSIHFDKSSMSTFLKLDSSLAKFMGELSLASNESVAVSIAELDDSVFVVDEEGTYQCTPGRQTDMTFQEFDKDIAEKTENHMVLCHRTTGEELGPVSESSDVMPQRTGLNPLQQITVHRQDIDIEEQEDILSSTESFPKSDASSQLSRNSRAEAKLNSPTKANAKVNCVKECLMREMDRSNENMKDSISKSTRDCSLAGGQAVQKPTKGELSQSYFSSYDPSNLSTSSRNEKNAIDGKLQEVTPNSSRLEGLVLNKARGDELHNGKNSSTRSSLFRKTLNSRRGKVRKAKKKQKTLCRSLEDSVLIEDSLLKVLQNMSPENATCRDSPDIVTEHPQTIFAKSRCRNSASPTPKSSHQLRAQLMTLFNQLTPGDSPLTIAKFKPKPDERQPFCSRQQKVHCAGGQSSHVQSAQNTSTARVPINQSTNCAGSKRTHAKPVQTTSTIKRSTKSNNLELSNACCEDIPSSPVGSEIQTQDPIHLQNVSLGDGSKTSLHESHRSSHKGTSTASVPHRPIPTGKSKKTNDSKHKSSLHPSRSKSLVESIAMDKKTLNKQRALSQPMRTSSNLKVRNRSKHKSCSQIVAPQTRSNSSSSGSGFRKRDSILEMESSLAMILDGLNTG